MKKDRFSSYCAGICTGTILMLIAVIVTRYFVGSPSGGASSDEVWKHTGVVEGYIDKYYWKDDVSQKKMAEYAAKGMVAALGDKYSYYLTDEEYDDVMTGVNGDYYGIGATISMDTKTGKKHVQAVQEGAAADRAGLKNGDELLTVNGVDVTKKDLSETVKMIKGEAGKKAVLLIARKEGKKTVQKEITVVSEKIIHRSVESKMLDKTIGYIRIGSFDNETDEQFDSALKELEKKGQKAMIVDVRDNDGGSLTAVVAMLDFLLPKGKLITEKNKAKGDHVYESTDERHFDKPLAVLMNGNSASAAEVFAGTLQDRGAATLVGEKSYGKGIVQTIYSLKDQCGGGIKLTTGEYLLPSGRSIHEVGLTPDVEEKYTGEKGGFTSKSDNQFQKAITVLNNKLN